MSTWKLQKVCYYSQAWANGPVCPELFHEHQGKFAVGTDDLNKGDPMNSGRMQDSVCPKMPIARHSLQKKVWAHIMGVYNYG